MLTKSLQRVQVKDADQGTVSAVFASFDVVDRDGDVTVKGAIPDGHEVVISAYGHGSWKGALPVGKGVIRIDGNDAILDGQFFMDTTHGRDTFATVKQLGDLGEWSYSLSNVKSDTGEFKGQQVRFLRSIEVKEVSPVIRGAGTTTRTLETKSRKQLSSQIEEFLEEAGKARWGNTSDAAMPYASVYLEDYDPDLGFAVFEINSPAGDRMVQVAFERTDTAVTLGPDEIEVVETTVFLPKSQRGGARMKFSEHIASVLADVEALKQRASDVVALRAEKGKSLAPQTTELLKQVAAAVAELSELVETPEPPAGPTPDDDATPAVEDIDAAALAAELNALELDVIAADLEGDEQ